MLPEIVVFQRTIPLYGICAAVGAIAVLLYLRRYEKNCSVSFAGDIDLALTFGFVAGMVGSKVLYLLVNIQSLLFDLSEHQLMSSLLNKYLFGGFVFYGGLFGFIFAVFLYGRFNSIPFRELECPLLPSFSLFHAFGRIGCFFTGCCYGVQTNCALGLTFTHSKIAPNGVPLFPVQLVEALGEIILFVTLSSLSTKREISLTGIYFTIYGIMRFVLEFFRGDDYRGSIAFLSVSQAISIITIIIGTILIIRQSKQVHMSTSSNG